MFCPLCRSEFRVGVSRCPACEAGLISSLDSPEVQSNPAVLLWTGKDEREFAAVVDALRDARIPCRAREQPRAALGNRWRPESQIHVLQSDRKQALELMASKTEPLPWARQDVRACYACGAECRAAFAYCPHCEAVLIVEQESASPKSAAAPTGTPLACPVCRIEYSSEHTTCTACGVKLVPENLIGQPLDEKQKSDSLAVVWKGGDPVAVSRVIAELRRAGIRHHVKPTEDHLVFELGIPRPRYEVRVFSSDAAAALELLLPIREAPALALIEPGENSPGGETPAGPAPATRPRSSTGSRGRPRSRSGRPMTRRSRTF